MSNIASYLHQIVGADRLRSTEYELCYARNVKEQKGVCNAEPLNDAEAIIYNVVFFDSTSTYRMVPKEGSLIQVIYSKQDVPLVIYMTEIEAFHLAARQPITVKGNDESLKELLKKLTATVKGLKLLTNVGPTTGMMPDSLQKLTAIEATIEKLFKE